MWNVDLDEIVLAWLKSASSRPVGDDNRRGYLRRKIDCSMEGSTVSGDKGNDIKQWEEEKAEVKG